MLFVLKNWKLKIGGKTGTFSRSVEYICQQGRQLALLSAKYVKAEILAVCEYHIGYYFGG